MKKISRVTVAHILTGICIVIAGALVYYIVSSNILSGQLRIAHGEGTRIDFVIDSGAGVGFDRDTIIYTEHGISSLAFSGKITVDGTAEISVISDDDGSIIYSEIISNAKAKAINLNVTGLMPYSYYTLRFSSDDAKYGKLALATDQKLVKQPERPEKITPAIPRN